MNPRVSKQACRIRFDFGKVTRRLLALGKDLVRYRYHERSPVSLTRSRIVDRQVEARILIEPRRKLSQHEKPVGQNGETKEAENDRRD
jgi:hypothetical protein